MSQLSSVRGLALVVLLAWGGSQGASWWQDRRFAEAVREGSQRHELVIYSTDACPYCAKARAWLNAHSVRWQDCNVDHDAACLRSYDLQGAPGVPLVRVGALWNLGFSPAWVASAMSKLSDQSPSGASSPRP